jgi:hypothetical protein
MYFDKNDVAPTSEPTLTNIARFCEYRKTTPADLRNVCLSARPLSARSIRAVGRRHRSKGVPSAPWPTPALERKGFSKLIDRLESSDVLVVSKIDRLGRNAMDVRATVERLAEMGVQVHCLALGGVDLTSPAGRMTMQVLSAVAEFERDLLIERTQAGLTRAKAEGKALGRPSSLSQEDPGYDPRQASARGLPGRTGEGIRGKPLDDPAGRKGGLTVQRGPQAVLATASVCAQLKADRAEPYVSGQGQGSRATGWRRRKR